ncbi:MAG: DegT/DnrJ/EryC1/StrS family aminotransferase [Pseudomonadota bacterium]|nr:DegT/DnrJ/EryC1/StrS family aminotransferase [Pseudomonadota bacterium]
MRDFTSLPATELPPLQPWVPLAPVLAREAFATGRRQHVASILDAGQVRLVTSGRIAIGLALRAMGVAAGDIVLMPAYHSLSMIPPVFWRGAAPRFYRVTRAAQVDLADLDAKMDGRVKALVVTHYFGFMQNMAPIRAWCDRRRVALLEDCAHCFFGAQAGSFGDYAIASSMKFFPAYEGGVLASTRHDLQAITLHGAGAAFEIKVTLNTLEHSFAYDRLPGLRLLLALPLRAKDWLWKKRKAGLAAPVALAPASSDSEAGFDTAWLDKRSSWFARWLLRRVSHARIVTRRRAHYEQLQTALAGSAGARPLHAALPDGACPWMFPLIVDDADAVFTRLHKEGVPLTRFAEALWDGVDASVCANSVYLSRHVLAFPCHQELRPEELAWVIARIRAALQP